jgi:predicted nucleotidyltransferase
MVQNLGIETDRLAEFCRKHHICKLSFFGSVLGSDFRPDSDVDVLVRFDPAYTVGFRIFEMEEELSTLIGGRKVDFVNEKFLNRHLRSRILSEAQVQYAEG